MKITYLLWITELNSNYRAYCLKENVFQVIFNVSHWKLILSKKQRPHEKNNVIETVKLWILFSKTSLTYTFLLIIFLSSLFGAFQSVDKEVII